ncbi:MAG: hypothetical protein R3F17_13725 [Planctomycetota bacterium]
MALLPALQAMSGHPGAQGLWRALRELDVRQVPLGTLADFLEAAADLIRKGRYPGGLYYYATAPLWQELFRRGKAQAVATRLKRARAMVGPREEGFAIMLLLELVRSNVLRADEAWIEASLAELSQVHHALPDWVDAELELVERLLHYRRLLPEFLNGNALRERMHECIVAMAEGPPGEARLRFLRLMNEFVDDPAALQEAVPPRAPGEAEGLASMLLVGMGSELSEGEVQPIAQSGGLDRLAPFLYRLQNETSRTRLGAVEDILGRVLGFGLVIGLVVVMATIAESLPSRWSIPIIVVGVLGAWKLAGRPFGLLARAFLPRLYRKVWRERAFEFLAASRMGYYELLDSLLHIEGDELTEQHRLYVGASEDSALPLYSMALRFAR